ncbi:MAG: hypothetical protein CM1200mP1_13940 [Candidatus Neomarinimicrobiota bacterium]|nr:MAG: hypothetical protein CM1200mP1_13940 [Candidatus Neomarinimicrobiota bacterium]
MSVSSENNGLVGVILPYVTNRYYPKGIGGIHEALRIGGYQILLITTDDGEEFDEKFKAALPARKNNCKFFQLLNLPTLF